jgi:hypothetical protein
VLSHVQKLENQVLFSANPFLETGQDFHFNPHIAELQRTADEEGEKVSDRT